MKVIFLTGSLNQGGAEFQILALARLFKEKGNEVEVFALTDYSFYKPYLAEHNIKYSHLLNNQSKIKRIWLTAKKFREVKPDVVVAYLRVVGQMAIYSRLLSLRSFKILISERTSLTIHGYDTYYFNLMRAATFLTVNSITKYDYIKSNFPFLSTKTFFFPNILDLKAFKPASTRLNGELKVSFIGRISPEKNVVELISAISILLPQYPNLTLNIYGDARNTDYMEKVRAAIDSDITLQGHVIIHGKSNNMTEVYKETNLLCLISDFEGFSNVVSEALCCGIPVIASDIKENRYLIEDGINGFLVNQESVEDIAVGISKFLQLNDAAKDQISRNNRAKAENMFNNNRIYSDYISVINHSSR